jgi:hypothetical protein
VCIGYENSTNSVTHPPAEPAPTISKRRFVLVLKLVPHSEQDNFKHILSLTVRYVPVALITDAVRSAY